jgi:glycosyltransferase involved in cell wall biosynthesis
MKILFILPEYPPHNIGGGGATAKKLVEKLNELGHELVVFYGYYPNTDWSAEIKKYENKGITFYQVPQIPYPKSKPFLRTYMPPTFRAHRQMKKIISSIKADGVNIQGYGLISTNLASRILRKQNIKYNLTMMGYPDTPYQSLPTKLFWKYFYIPFLMDPTMNNASKIICKSNFVRQNPHNTYKDESVVIPNGFAIEDYQDIQKEFDIREKHSISEDEKVILSLGRISEMKGFQEIITRIPKFLEKGVKVRYLIAGTDEGYKKTLDNLIKDYKVEKYVNFIGQINLKQKRQYLDQCDYFAASSLFEWFGNIAIEGAYFDKLVLTSNKGDFKDILKDYNKKVIFYEDDFVEQCLKKENIKGNFDVSKYNWENVAKQYIDSF